MTFVCHDKWGRKNHTVLSAVPFLSSRRFNI